MAYAAHTSCSRLPLCSVRISALLLSSSSCFVTQLCRRPPSFSYWTVRSPGQHRPPTPAMPPSTSHDRVMAPGLLRRLGGVAVPAAATAALVVTGGR